VRAQAKSGVNETVTDPQLPAQPRTQADSPSYATAQDKRAATTRPILECAAVTLLALIVFFFHLGSYGLWEPDEARYAEIAREMLSGGNLLVPHLNYVPYIEKPPLLYWMTTLAFHFLGVNEFAARFVPGASALCGVLLTYWLGRCAFDHRRAILAAAILTTSPLYAVMAQVLTTDMLLTALLSVAFFAFYAQWRSGGRWWLAMYAAAALAVLTKGPVGVILPGLAGLLFLWRQGALRGSIKNFHVVAGALLVAAVALPWFAIMAVRLPGFVQFYVVGEHFRRVFVSTYSHNEPFYFYLPVILLGLLPWSICLPLLLIDATRGPARSLCAIAAGVVVVLFSAADAKLIPYVLPALPPLALLLADSILSALEPRVMRWPRLNTGSVVAAIGPALCVGGVACIVVAMAGSHIRNRDVALLGQVILTIGAVLLAGGAAATAAFLRNRSEAGLALIAATTALALLIGSYGRIKVEALHSYAPLSRELALQAPASTLIDYHRYPQAIPFYTGRRVILAGPFRSELGFGAQHSPDRAQYFLDSDADLLNLWARDPSPVLVIDAAELRHLAAQLGPLRVITAQGHKLAVTKAASPKPPERD
jgi:4-amino-4-deoxy-L-arabinose transferase-like glycosyltransferase